MKKLFILSIISLIGFSSCDKKNVTCERNVYVGYINANEQGGKHLLGTITGDLPEGGIDYVLDSTFREYNYETDSMIIYSMNYNIPIDSIKFWVLDGEMPFIIEKEAHCH
jgi:hypothetical protein